MWHVLSTKFKSLGAFASELQSVLRRLEKTAGGLIKWSPEDGQSSLICSICRDPHWGLLANDSCGHSACEECWTHWIGTQVDQCRAAKSLAFKCIGPCCQDPISGKFLTHAEISCEPVRAMHQEMKQRKRLQQNTLFPTSMQVDCPVDGCLGLGYLGSETIMCFFCEHQWEPEEPNTQQDVDPESLFGTHIKKCPRCKVYIMKDGGCDHMTCRCRHQFWWSTLMPFH